MALDSDSLLYRCMSESSSIATKDKFPRDDVVLTVAQDVSQEDTREFVTWGGPDDPENPKNWSYAYKWWITIIVCVLSLEV